MIFSKILITKIGSKIENLKKLFLKTAVVPSPKCSCFCVVDQFSWSDFKKYVILGGN